MKPPTGKKIQVPVNVYPKPDTPDAVVKKPKKTYHIEGAPSWQNLKAHPWR